jgi:hypothetical protein
MLIFVVVILTAFAGAPMLRINDTSHIDIRGEITPKMYDSVIGTIRAAQPNTILFVFINSPGGYAQVGYDIASALDNCKATVIDVIDGMVASAAVNVMIAGDYVCILKYDMVLIHASYLNLGGIILHVFPGSQADHDFQKTKYKGYLTPSEEKFVFEDWGDLILTQKTFLNRVDNDITHLKQLKEIQNGDNTYIINTNRHTRVS